MKATTILLFQDHLHRVLRAATGFHFFGRGWLKPWLAYLLSPVSNRLKRGVAIQFDDFKVRRGEADLYTFANLFEDYPVPLIRAALSEIDLVVDLGANVGAFSWLISRLCREQNLRRQIVALEPNPENASFLRSQPFAANLEIEEAAVGPVDGTGHLIAGANSVTDHVDFSGTKSGRPVRVRSLASLCPHPALVKMDIEGGEWPILRQGLPANIRHLLLEWHANGSVDHGGRSRPPDFIPGEWKQVSSDLYGSTMWYFRRAS